MYLTVVKMGCWWLSGDATQPAAPYIVVSKLFLWQKAIRELYYVFFFLQHKDNQIFPDLCLQLIYCTTPLSVSCVDRL